MIAPSKNGKRLTADPASDNINNAPPGDQAAGVAVRVFSVPDSAQAHVWMLSPAYGGCFTHWLRKTYYCKGSECPTRIHATERVWKGYAAALVYDAVRDKWTPAVLEITEHLELDLRQVYARGQVWTVFRAPYERGGRPVCQGRLMEIRSDEATPPAFNVQHVLHARYHCEVRLDARNPMPPRVVLQELDGARPDELVQEAPASPEEMRAFAKQLMDRNRRNAEKDRHNRA